MKEEWIVGQTRTSWIVADAPDDPKPWMTNKFDKKTGRKRLKEYDFWGRIFLTKEALDDYLWVMANRSGLIQKLHNCEDAKLWRTIEAAL